MGTMVAAGLTPGFIVASAAGSSIQGSHVGGLRPDGIINSNDSKVEECVVYNSVEQMPQFPGGEEALMKYLRSHLNYPPMESELGIGGRVVVRFIVDETGKVSDVMVIHSADQNLDREAVRVCKSLPKFTPGRHNGQAVSVWYTLPVTFKPVEEKKTTAADTIAIEGKTYSFDELYAKQHPDSVDMNGILPEVLVQAYPKALKYGPLNAFGSKPKDYDFEVLKGDTIYHHVERMPQFPGGEAALIKYIESHLRYPSKSLKNKVQGCVLVKFVVEETGKIGSAKVVLSVDKELDKEALRLVKSLPLFSPGRKNGEAVSVWNTLQVVFKLPEESDN